MRPRMASTSTETLDVASSTASEDTFGLPMSHKCREISNEASGKNV